MTVSNDNPSVAFLNALAVDPALIEELSELAFSGTGTRRICLHKSEASLLHVMLVESKPEQSFPAHFHSDSDEVSVAVSGQLEIVVWKDGHGEKPEKLILGGGHGGVPVSLIPKGVTHTTQAVGGNCIYLEVKLGPFLKDALVQVSSADLASV